MLEVGDRVKILPPAFFNGRVGTIEARIHDGRFSVKMDGLWEAWIFEQRVLERVEP